MLSNDNYKDAAPTGLARSPPLLDGGNDSFASPAMRDSGAGAFQFDLSASDPAVKSALVETRKRRMDEPKKTSSRAGKTIKLAAVCLFVGFALAIVIPNFIAASLSKASNACVNNLRQIESAKEQWILENSKGAYEVPTSNEIAAYLKNNQLPVCPEGGTYTVGRVNEDPTCSISTSAWPNDHVLNTTNSWWINFKAAYRAVFTQRPRSASH